MSIREAVATKRTFSVYLEPAMIEFLDELARDSRRSRSQVIEALLDWATKDKALAASLVGVID